MAGASRLLIRWLTSGVACGRDALMYAAEYGDVNGAAMILRDYPELSSQTDHDGASAARHLCTGSL